MKDQINEQGSIEWYIDTIHSKVEGVKKNYQEEIPSGYLLRDIKTLADEKYLIESVKIDEKQSITIEGKTDDLYQLAEYINDITTMEYELKDLEIKNLKYNHADYAFLSTLVFTYGGDSVYDIYLSGGE